MRATRKHPVIAPRRKAHGIGGVAHQLEASGIRLGDFFKQRAIGLGIDAQVRHAEFFKALLLPEPRRGNAQCHIGAGFLGRRQGEIGNAHRGQFDLDIHPVQQWPGNPRLIIRGTARAFLADVPRLARHAALARVHRGDELELRRIGDVIIGPRHHRLARFQRLPQ